MFQLIPRFFSALAHDMQAIFRRVLAIRRHLALLEGVGRRLGITLFNLVPPATLAIAAAVFAMGFLRSVSLLGNGLVAKDFSLARDAQPTAAIAQWFPHTFSSNFSLFVLLLVTMYLFSVCESIFTYFSMFSAQRLAAVASGRAARLLFRRFMSFGKLFFDHANIGEVDQVLVRYSEDIGVQMAAYQELLRFSFLFSAYVGFMLWISWRLTLLVILVLVLFKGGGRNVIRRLRRSSEQLAAARMEMNSRVLDIFSCIPLVKSYAREESESRAFDTLSDRAVAEAIGFARRMQLIPPVNDVANTTALVAVALFVVFFSVVSGSIDVGNVLVFFFVMRMSMVPFTQMISFFLTATNEVPLRKVLEILDDRDKPFVRDGKKKFRGLTSGIEFRHLQFQYSDRVPVLKDVSLSIERGTMTALVGPTGGGKTTLVSLLLRFYDCAPKSIFLDGVDIRDLTIATLLQHISYVGQDVLLVNGTIRQNILYGTDMPVSEATMQDVLRRAQLTELIKQLPDGLDTPLGDRGARLSGGEKQRVSLARALLKDAEIVILDEATSALDVETEQLLQQAIEEVLRGRTTIVVAHRLSTVGHADQVAVLEGGRIVEHGPFQELVGRGGRFAQYWAAQTLAPSHEREIDGGKPQA